MPQVIAYLHDVVEDADIELNTIEIEFGKFVADCVSILTDEAGNNRKERKEKTNFKMKNVSGELEMALIVKASDRLANMLACIADNNHELLSMYKNEHEAFKNSVYREGLCDMLWYELDRIFNFSQHNGYTYQFWLSKNHGLIRQKSRFKELHHPEVIEDKKWVTGSPYVMDTITGMGEDPSSCGEMALEVLLEKAEKLGKDSGIGLYD